MIHIKLFESFKKEEMYEPIGWVDWVEWVQGDYGKFSKAISFTEGDVSELVVLERDIGSLVLRSFGVLELKRRQRPSSKSRVVDVITLSLDGWITIDITKHDDDWFLCSVSEIGQRNIYKCDQIDGVVQCVKDRLDLFLKSPHGQE